MACQNKCHSHSKMLRAMKYVHALMFIPVSLLLGPSPCYTDRQLNVKTMEMIISFQLIREILFSHGKFRRDTNFLESKVSEFIKILPDSFAAVSVNGLVNLEKNVSGLLRIRNLLLKSLNTRPYMILIQYIFGYLTMCRCTREMRSIVYASPFVSL